MSFESINRFKGLNNVSDPVRLKLGWLSRADNVDVTNTGAIERRSGYARRLVGAFTGAFATEDMRRMYAVRDQELIQVALDMTTTTLAALTGTGRMYWAEVNKQVFFNNGVDSGIITEGGSVLPWAWSEPPAPGLSYSSGPLPSGVYQACFTFLLADGRETGAGAASAVVAPEGSALAISGVPQVAGTTTLIYVAPANSSVFQLAGSTSGSTYTWGAGADTLGRQLATAFVDPIPLGATVIQHWRGQMYAAQFLPSANQTVIWTSEPLGFHLFNLNSGFFMVPGQVEMLAAHDDALIVGTGDGIFVYTGEALDQVATYGVVPGHPWVFDTDGEKILIWTKRGVCRAMPFENLTQEYVSVPPGTQAGVALVRRDGHKRLVANLVAGGSAFNQRN